MRGTLLRAVVGVATAILAIGLTPIAAASPIGSPGADRSAEHRRIVQFWTRDKVAKAIPRDFGFDPVTNKYQPVRKPVPVAPADQWTSGGEVAKTTGRVLFAMGNSYYVCSASVVDDDTLADRSIILTAAHCVYDEGAKAFATNWMFIPSYDSGDPSVMDVSVCNDSDYGCWTALALVVDKEYTDAGGFNTQATLHDFAFAVVGPGGNASKSTQLDSAVGSQPINTQAATLGSETYLFGYPLAAPYTGNKDLRYSNGPLSTDPLNGGNTYRVSSLMTGGASGGPWFTPFDPTNNSDSKAPAFGEGTMMSVNSYGYTRNSYSTSYDDTKMMYGPKFNAETQSLFGLAQTATESTISAA